MASEINTTTTSDTPKHEVTFTPPLIQRTGNIGGVLVDLMTSQTRKIQEELQQEFGWDQVSNKSLGKVLNSFVSLEGTKQPRRTEELQFPDIPEKLVLAIVKKLQSARLLRESEDGVYELAHDTLAAHLNQSRDQDDIALDETVKMVKDAFYFQEKTKRFLQQRELEQVENFAETIRSTNRLTDEEWAFVEASEKKEKLRTLRMRAAFFLALGAAVLMTVLFIRAKNAEIENKKLLGDIGINLDALRANKELTQQTAEALRSSRNDRTNAFLKLRDVQSSNTDSANQVLVNQLTQNLLSEFSLFPFYNLSRKLDEDISKLIVEDNLKFITAVSKDSPLAFYKDSLLQNPQDPFKRFSSKSSKYGKIRDMVLMDDGQTVLTAHSDRKIWKWTVGVDEAIDSVYHFESKYFNEDMSIRTMVTLGDRLLVAMDSLVYEYDMKRKKPARFIIGFNRPIKFLIANPKVPDQFAIVKENSNEIFLCNHDTIGKIVKIFAPGRSTVTSLAYSPDGRKMIAGYEDGEVAKLWALKRPQLITEFKGHQALISSIAFSHDGRQVITGSWDQTAILWTNKGEIVKRLVGHENRIQSVAYTKNNFGVTSSEDGDIKTWYLAPLAEKELIFEDSIRALAVSPKHDTIAFSLYGDQGFFHLWHWPSNTLDTVWQPLKNFDRKGDIVALAYAEDGLSIVAASENTLTTVIDRSGKGEHEDYRGGGKAQIPSTSSIAAVDINDDYVLIADRASKKVLLRSRKDPAVFRAFSHPNRVYDAKFSPNNQYVLSACNDAKAYLWDLSATTDNPVKPRLLTGHTSRVVSVDFSPDGRYILTGSYDNTAILYEFNENEKGNLTTEFKLEGINPSYTGHTSDVNKVAFSNEVIDSTYRFTTASSDKMGKYWELRKDNTLHELPSVIRHLNEITVSAFLPGDSLIVTGGFDETIKVWRAGQVNKLIDQRVLEQ